MDFSKLLEEKKISKYKLSKQSGVPYSTICDICTGKSDILKCSAETVIRLGHILGMTAEEIIGDIEYPEIKESGKKASKDADKTAKERKSKEGKTKESRKSSKDENGKSKTGRKSVKDTDKAQADAGKNSSSASSGSMRRAAAADNADAIAARNAAKEEAYRNYCNNLMAQVESMGELNFLVSYLKNNEVVILYNLNRKRESRFLLSLLDELCVKNNFPICKEYEEIRNEESEI
ncbi:MAG: hypothetical protein K5776_00290 [Lachnospiraceae bacterium]|nr:hypothetical protein [Lachnospiraceae bacterium]